MRNQKILNYIQDSDGTTRDINFTPARFEDVAKFLSALFLEYEKGSLSDQDGEDLKFNAQSVVALFERETGYVHGIFESEKAMVKHIQLFLDWPEDGRCAVELSFFPDDLKEDFDLEEFLSKVNTWWDILKSNEIFIRYENASWKWYDPKGLGVFYHRTRV